MCVIILQQYWFVWVEGPQYIVSLMELLNKDLPCKVNVVLMYGLVPPHELMPATDTLYSALGTKPWSVALVLGELTVVRTPPLVL